MLLGIKVILVLINDLGLVVEDKSSIKALVNLKCILLFITM